MKEYAIKRGVDEADILIDYAGFNTYDSCYRAEYIFDVHSAILVSQGYHLPRAVMTCRGLGIDSIGVAATHNSRDWTVSYIVREFASTDKALVQYWLKPQPTVLRQPD